MSVLRALQAMSEEELLAARQALVKSAEDKTGSVPVRDRAASEQFRMMTSVIETDKEV